MERWRIPSISLPYRTPQKIPKCSSETKEFSSISARSSACWNSLPWLWIQTTALLMRQWLLDLISFINWWFLTGWNTASWIAVIPRLMRSKCVHDCIFTPWISCSLVICMYLERNRADGVSDFSRLWDWCFGLWENWWTSKWKLTKISWKNIVLLSLYLIIPYPEKGRFANVLYTLT